MPPIRQRDENKSSGTMTVTKPLKKLSSHPKISPYTLMRLKSTPGNLLPSQKRQLLQMIPHLLSQRSTIHTYKSPNESDGNIPPTTTFTTISNTFQKENQKQNENIKKDPGPKEPKDPKDPKGSKTPDKKDKVITKKTDENPSAKPLADKTNKQSGKLKKSGNEIDEEDEEDEEDDQDEEDYDEDDDDDDDAYDSYDSYDDEDDEDDDNDNDDDDDDEDDDEDDDDDDDDDDEDIDKLLSHQQSLKGANKSGDETPRSHWPTISESAIAEQSLPEIPAVPGSLLNGLAIADIRRSLALIRAAWAAHAPDRPVCPSAPLLNGMTARRFSFYFALDHHMVFFSFFFPFFSFFPFFLFSFFHFFFKKNCKKIILTHFFLFFFFLFFYFFYFF